jgi:hypothetical protein
MMAVNESKQGVKYKKPKSKIYFNHCSQLVCFFLQQQQKTDTGLHMHERMYENNVFNNEGLLKKVDLV